MSRSKKRAIEKKSTERMEKAMSYLGSYDGPGFWNEKGPEKIWKDYDLEKIKNDAVCFMFYDALMNAGEIKAVRTIQAVIRKDLGKMDIEINGDFKKETIDAINDADPEKLFELFNSRISAYYNAREIKGYDETKNIIKEILKDDDGGSE